MKNSYINRPRQHKLTNKSLKSLRYTRRLARKKICVYMVFHNESNDIEFYKNETIPALYIALTTEEATAACVRLAYVQHLDHYIRWCLSRNLKPGLNEGSWRLYSTEVLGGLNNFLNSEFKIICAIHSLGDFFSIYRTFNNCLTILGLPTETSGELLEFVTKAEITYPPSDEQAHTFPTLVDISNPSSQSYNNPAISQLYSVLHCTDIGDFLGRLSLLDFDWVIGNDQKQPPILSIWRQMVQQIYFNDNDNDKTNNEGDNCSSSQSPSIWAIVFDKSVDTVSRLTSNIVTTTTKQSQPNTQDR